MSENKRGAVLVIQAGDEQIVEALTDGIMAGRAARLEAAQIETVQAEIDRQEVQRALLRVAVGNTKSAKDYAMMRFEAEMAYGESVDNPSPLRRLFDKALGIYGLFVYALHSANRAQEKVLGG